MIVNPIEIARYTTEFYALSRSVRNATKMGESSALANFEQLVELGKSSKQLDANDSAASSRSSTGSGSTPSTSAPRTSTSSRGASAASSASASTA